MEELPDEPLSTIMSNLSLRDLSSMSQVNRRSYLTAYDDSVWRKKYERDFGQKGYPFRKIQPGEAWMDYYTARSEMFKFVPNNTADPRTIWERISENVTRLEDEFIIDFTFEEQEEYLLYLLTNKNRIIFLEQMPPDYASQLEPDYILLEDELEQDSVVWDGNEEYVGEISRIYGTNLGRLIYTDQGYYLNQFDPEKFKPIQDLPNQMGELSDLYHLIIGNAIYSIEGTNDELRFELLVEFRSQIVKFKNYSKNLLVVLFDDGILKIYNSQLELLRDYQGVSDLGWNSQLQRPQVILQEDGQIYGLNDLELEQITVQFPRNVKFSRQIRRLS